MDAPTFDDTPRPIPRGPTYEIRDATGQQTLMDILQSKSMAHTLCEYFGPVVVGAFRETRDGRGGNARDRRRARRAGRLWRSLPDVVRDAYDGPDASERAAALMTETMNRLCWEGGR